MHRSLCTISLFTALLSSGLASQKTCFEANQSMTLQGGLLNAAAATFALKENSGASGSLVTAVDFYMIAGASTTSTVSIWDENTATGTPGNLLASGSVTLVTNLEGWYGALVTPPVSIAPNTNFFLGVDLNGGIRPMLIVPGLRVRTTPYWFNQGTAWSGPHVAWGWKYRVYCGTHRGSFASYGAGKAGSGNAVPLLMGQGFPNTGNLITLNLSKALGSTTAILVWGARADIPISIGQLYVSPIVLTTFGTTLAFAPGVGYLLTDVTIPLDPSLAGARVAFQSWVVDAGAPGNVSHSNGLEAIVGH